MSVPNRSTFRQKPLTGSVDEFGAIVVVVFRLDSIIFFFLLSRQRQRKPASPMREMVTMAMLQTGVCTGNRTLLWSQMGQSSFSACWHKKNKERASRASTYKITVLLLVLIDGSKGGLSAARTKGVAPRAAFSFQDLFPLPGGGYLFL